MCLPKLAPYGHAASGGFWDEKPYGGGISCGWEPVQDRRGVFYKPKEDALMMIYVGDFKFSCKEQNMERSNGACR